MSKEPPRLILSHIDPAKKEFLITGKEHHYLTRVIRSDVEDEVLLLDGRGSLLLCKIKKIDQRSLMLNKIGSLTEDRESPVNLILLQGILKAQKMDLVIQKCTELGVKEIFPVVTERAVVRYTRKVSHWQEVAKEAARQSRRLVMPVVHEPLDFKEAIGEMDKKENKIIFYEGNDEISLPFGDRTNEIVYFIGPEGGFSKREIEEAVGEGFRVSGLGKRILRAETASIVATVLLQHHYGDLRTTQGRIRQP